MAISRTFQIQPVNLWRPACVGTSLQLSLSCQGYRITRKSVFHNFSKRYNILLKVKVSINDH